MKYVIPSASLLIVLTVPTAYAGDIEVEFNEVELPNLTLLDGTDYFEPFGISFEDETFWAIDERFIGAGVDEVGITTTTGANNIMTVFFTPEVTVLTIDFLTVLGSDLTGTAFDSAGQSLDSFFFDPAGEDPAYGSHTFSDIGNIAAVTFSDGAGQIGVGRLLYTQVDGGCLAVTSQEVVCHPDGTTFTVNIEGLNACTGGTTQVTFTASGGAVGEEMCFTVLVNADGGFCCSTEICVTIPDCSASAVTIIDFDELTDGDVVTNQFQEATFSSSAGNVNSVAATAFTHTPPNFICTGPAGGSINCVEDTFVDFTNAVDSLTFWAIGVCGVGTVAEVNVFVGDVFDTTVDIVGLGDQLTPFMVDLSSFSNVTRIELVNITDLFGIGWDTFSFSVMTELPCDLNGDGIVGITDFLSLLSAWGLCSDCGTCPADFDGDCSVGIQDMLILLGNWG